MAFYSYLLFVSALLALISTVRLDSASHPGSRRNAENSQEVTFRLYNKGCTFDNPETNENGEKITFRKLLVHKPIKILIHGWRGDKNSIMFQKIIKETLTHSADNIITVDWSALNSKNVNYVAVRMMVPQIAAVVAKFIDSLHKQRNANLNRIHIIGHSLGAHIAGIAGYLVTTGKIGRITGLDPAQPLFSVDKPRERLSVDSAKFVDVIHSSSNLEGFGAPIGHADFYPNGPKKHQPGCGTDITGICSHSRANLYYAESISKPNAFLAVPCKDWIHFERKECDIKKVVPMGESTPLTARGTYYLATNSKEPFGTGTIWR